MTAQERFYDLTHQITMALPCNALKHKMAGALALGNITELSKAANFATQADEALLLHAAAGVGHLDILKALVEAGLDLLKTDVDGLTPVVVAHECQQFEAAEYLAAQLTVQQKADPHIELVRLIRENAPPATETAVALLRKAKIGRDANYSLHETGKYPLHHAAEVGCVRVAECLLEYEATVAVLDADGEPPLLTAAKNQQWEVVIALSEATLKASAEIEAALHAQMQEKLERLQGRLSTVNHCIKTFHGLSQGQQHGLLGREKLITDPLIMLFRLYDSFLQARKPRQLRTEAIQKKLNARKMAALNPRLIWLADYATPVTDTKPGNKAGIATALQRIGWMTHAPRSHLFPGDANAIGLLNTVAANGCLPVIEALLTAGLSSVQLDSENQPPFLAAILNGRWVAASRLARAAVSGSSPSTLERQLRDSIQDDRAKIQNGYQHILFCYGLFAHFRKHTPNLLKRSEQLYIHSGLQHLARVYLGLGAKQRPSANGKALLAAIPNPAEVAAHEAELETTEEQVGWVAGIPDDAAGLETHLAKIDTESAAQGEDFAHRAECIFLLHRVAALGNAGVITKLLALRINPNQLDEHWQPPFLVAARHKKWEACFILANAIEKKPAPLQEQFNAKIKGQKQRLVLKKLNLVLDVYAIFKKAKIHTKKAAIILFQFQQLAQCYTRLARDTEFHVTHSGIWAKPITLATAAAARTSRL